MSRLPPLGATVDRALLAAIPLPPLAPHSDKDKRGRVLVVAGGRGVPGAPILTGLAALRVGAGKLKLAAPPETAVALGVAVPEALIVSVPADGDGEIPAAAEAEVRAAAKTADALVVGPGMLSDETGLLAARLSDSGPALVLDAGALEGLGAHVALLQAAAGRLVLTPHAGEMASLLECDREAVLAAPEETVRLAARRFGAVTLLKGQTTLIASPDGLLWRHLGGVAGLGTSGSGDVLAGLIAGFLARGAPPMAAAAWGVWVHGASGERLAATVGPLGFLAREILDVAPSVLARATCDDGATPGPEGDALQAG